MKKNNKKGIFIVFEGVDGSGKTTCIKGVIKKLSPTYKAHYNKGMGSNTFFGKLARKHPSTALFSLELIWQTLFQIRPQLKRGNTVLQDRYISSISSFPTAMSKKINQLIIWLVKPLIVKPDLIIHLTVNQEVCVTRLKQDLSDNTYHQILVDNPGLIDQRRKNFEQVLADYKDILVAIDTSHNVPKTTIEQVVKIIKGRYPVPITRYWIPPPRDTCFAIRDTKKTKKCQQLTITTQKSPHSVLALPTNATSTARIVIQGLCQKLT